MMNYAPITECMSQPWLGVLSPAQDMYSPVPGISPLAAFIPAVVVHTNVTGTQRQHLQAAKPIQAAA